jgi:hypothetical protein
MSIYGSQIYVLPCLQELKNQSTGIGRLASLEYEQQPGKWTGSRVVPLFGGLAYGSANATDYFDKYWSGTQIPQNLVGDVTKNGLLAIPNCSDYGFKSNNYITSTQCKDFTCSQKWTIYTNFLKNHTDPYKTKNIALFVTHHNRMRDTLQGILPFIKDSEYDAYANNFCLKISISNDAVDYSLFFAGFPDKGEFDIQRCSIPDLNNLVGGGYDYLCETDITQFIDTDSITTGIKAAGITGFACDIYVIRHGNSLHNKPVEISDFNNISNLNLTQNRLDSSLTPLGMYQAYLLGSYFKNQRVFENNPNIVLCCSFLQRTQLTGLLLLKAAGINFNQLDPGFTPMLRQALIRYSRAQTAGFDPTDFLFYSPLGRIIKYKDGTKANDGNVKNATKFVYYLKNYLSNPSFLPSESETDAGLRNLIQPINTWIEKHGDNSTGGKKYKTLKKYKSRKNLKKYKSRKNIKKNKMRKNKSKKRI